MNTSEKLYVWKVTVSNMKSDLWIIAPDICIAFKIAHEVTEKRRLGITYSTPMVGSSINIECMGLADYMTYANEYVARQ